MFKNRIVPRKGSPCTRAPSQETPTGTLIAPRALAALTGGVVRLQTLIVASMAGLAAAGAPALAQDTAKIRVGSPTAEVLSRPQARSEVMTTAVSGTVLDLLARDGDWHWVVLPPDAYGTRRTGWLHARDVEGAVERDARRSERSGSEEDAAEVEERNAKRAAEEERKANEAASRAAAKQAKDDAKRAKAEAKAAAEAAKRAAEEARRAEAEDRRVKKAEEDLQKARREYEQLTGGGTRQ
jgi:hypothetical protein